MLRAAQAQQAQAAAQPVRKGLTMAELERDMLLARQAQVPVAPQQPPHQQLPPFHGGPPPPGFQQPDASPFAPIIPFQQQQQQGPPPPGFPILPSQGHGRHPSAAASPLPPRFQNPQPASAPATKSAFSLADMFPALPGAGLEPLPATAMLGELVGADEEMRAAVKEEMDRKIREQERLEEKRKRRAWKIQGMVRSTSPTC